MWRSLLPIALGLVLVLALGVLFTNVLAYVIIALVIATVLEPLVNFLCRWRFGGVRLPRTIAVVLSFLVLLSVGGLIVLLFVPLIEQQSEVLGEVSGAEVSSWFTLTIGKVEKWVLDAGLSDQEPGFLMSNLDTWKTDLLGKMKVGNVIGQVFSWTGGVLVGAMAVIFTTFIFLLERGFFRRHLVAALPNRYFEVGVTAIARIGQLLSQYLRGLVLQVMIFFVAATVGLLIVDVRFAATIALFAAIVNLIPYVGPIAGILFGLVVGWSSLPAGTDPEVYYWLAFKLAIVFAGMQVIDNVVVQPLIFSRSVKAHPLEVVLVIFAGGTLAGMMGMILAIPVYTVLRVVIVELSKGLRGYALLRNSTQPTA